MSYKIDEFDRKILNIIQSDYPIDSRPYAVVGERIGLSEDEVLERVNRLRDEGVIRRIGANFGSRQLGWRSTLCAAQVPEERLDDFVAEVNRHEGVTHNYLRQNQFNVWFTYIGPDWEDVEATLAEITERTGIKVLNLPADKMFKIKVDFNVKDNKA
ncbi:MAG: siroheme decarboxylase subunit alpha [Desulfovibrio sp.]|jgi:DNA-binding Lrp family transcriptional regulator|nr:siroheme decarboxylase subunit alpha [Desulfovibrio sp.]